MKLLLLLFAKKDGEYKSQPLVGFYILQALVYLIKKNDT
jgi:hypothetical protein